MSESKTTKIDSGISNETSPTALNELVHILTAENLIKALKSEGGLSPGILQCALRFLSDNNITSKDLPVGVVEAIQSRYADKAPFKLAREDNDE